MPGQMSLYQGRHASCAVGRGRVSPPGRAALLRAGRSAAAHLLAEVAELDEAADPLLVALSRGGRGGAGPLRRSLRTPRAQSHD
jgi:hypothetical protein